MLLFTLMVLCALGGAEAQHRLASGFYVMSAQPVTGWPIGPMTGSVLGVQWPDTWENPANEWAVVEYPQGYILHLSAGNAAATSSPYVSLVQSYPGTFWNISDVNFNDGWLERYTIQTFDGQYGWILPHNAPAGTPVPLGPRNPSDMIIPAQWFDFYPLT